MMIAAPIGPTPVMSVSVVPDAATAATTRFLEALIAASSQAMSSINLVAISTRRRAASSSAWTCSSRSRALVTVIFRAGAAGGEFEQQRMEPGAMLGAQPSEVSVLLDHDT